MHYNDGKVKLGSISLVLCVDAGQAGSLTSVLALTSLDWFSKGWNLAHVYAYRSEAHQDRVPQLSVGPTNPMHLTP